MQPVPTKLARKPGIEMPPTPRSSPWQTALPRSSIDCLICWEGRCNTLSPRHNDADGQHDVVGAQE
eukprot:3166865-Alexandrium_andersonii.AAC.1